MDLAQSGGAYSVKLLQLALSRAGYDPGEIDGILGQRTNAALRAFRDANGIPDNPRSTWAALRPYLTGYILHRIRRGDSIWSLAQMSGTTIQAVTTANPALVPQNLQVAAIAKIPFPFDVVPTNIPWSGELMSLVTEGLLARYPFLTAGTFGRSVMGRDLLWLSIGEGDVPVGYNASHHANEWLTTPVLLKFLEQYAFAYSADGEIGGYSARNLFAKTTLCLMPLVNPDGVDLVTGALYGGRYYDTAAFIAESYPSIPFPDGWKANIRGTDLNLNYPAGWEIARKIKFTQGFASPAPRDYVGPSALSEPESRAIHAFTLSLNFALTLSYHSQGEVIFWKYADYNPQSSYEIALRMGEASGYAVEETPAASGHAGYKDWFIQDFNRPGYTIEVGLGVNPLPLSDFDDIYAKNEELLAIGMDAAGNLNQ